MYTNTIIKQEWALASENLKDAYTDFILSRQAKLCSKGMIRLYGFTAGKFIKWLENSGINSTGQITTRHVREYLAYLSSRDLSDSYIHSHARAIRTLLRFFHEEEYVSHLIKFEMPPIREMNLPLITSEEIPKVLKACKTKRDKALVLFLIDSGLRRAELCNLNWGDIDISSGLARVERGKGGKPRSVVIGIKTRRALLAYRREISHKDSDPLFQTRGGKRLTPGGLRSALLRIGKRAEIHITPHALRRTFATLSLKAGMNLIYLQGLLGHSSIEMTRHYVQTLDEDLLKAHQEHGPIDSFLK